MLLNSNLSSEGLILSRLKLLDIPSELGSSSFSLSEVLVRIIDSTVPIDMSACSSAHA